MDSRQSQQVIGGSHHVSKRDATAGTGFGVRKSSSRSGAGAGNSSKRKELTIAESLMGSGDSEDSEEQESTEHGRHSKISVPSQPHSSDDENDEDIEGSGDMFKPHSKPKATGTTKRPGHVNGPPPLREDTDSSHTGQLGGGGHSTSTEIPTSTSTLSSTTTWSSTSSSVPISSTRRPLIAPASTTSMPEDDEDSEDEGDYEGSGTSELSAGKATGHISAGGGVFSSKDRNRKKQEESTDDSSSKSIAEDPEEYYDEDENEDSDLDETEILSLPKGSSSPTSGPSSTSSSTILSTIAPATTTTTTTAAPSTTSFAIPSTTIPSSTTASSGSVFGSAGNADLENDTDDEDDGEDDDEDDGDDDGSDTEGAGGVLHGRTGAAAEGGESTALDEDKYQRGNKPGPSGHLPDGNGVASSDNSHGYDTARRKETDDGKSGSSGPSRGGGGQKWDAKGDESRENSQENDITHDSDDDNKISSGEVLLRHKATQRPSTLLGQPGILVAVMGGAVVGLLLAILCVMFVVYRMRKKDEGSYPLGKRNHDDHFSTHRRNYMRPSANKEFYA
ncbi:syndecan-like isoform X3 [Varroa destructor]|nr:syndecan-like isoform X3 [Varroa destructor]XP_022645330.1 syndecan-like isoform X3 [Varroa destructor]XP_022645331.1 syndecan-like isoform X3 [Varroa destructor]XP_022645333.1 syndecan-like isoform X3 [Varroa destructor]XP_022645334.1 syndecan-like isoform X3 [Varroa destructor]